MAAPSSSISLVNQDLLHWLNTQEEEFTAMAEDFAKIAQKVRQAKEALQLEFNEEKTVGPLLLTYNPAPQIIQNLDQEIREVRGKWETKKTSYFNVLFPSPCVNVDDGAQLEKSQTSSPMSKEAIYAAIKSIRPDFEEAKAQLNSPRFQALLHTLSEINFDKKAMREQMQSHVCSRYLMSQILERFPWAIEYAPSVHQRDPQLIFFAMYKAQDQLSARGVASADSPYQRNTIARILTCADATVFIETSFVECVVQEFCPENIRAHAPVVVRTIRAFSMSKNPFSTSSTSSTGKQPGLLSKRHIRRLPHH